MLEFIGPLPPPLHGFSWVNSQMLTGLQQRADVRVRNRIFPNIYLVGKNRLFTSIIGLFQWVHCFILCFFRKPKSFYIACSGGAGLLIDTQFVLAAKLFKIPVYLHHHSFLYLNTPDNLSRFCFLILRKCNHIVLNPSMGNILSNRYKVPLKNIFSLSNSAFLNINSTSFEKLNANTFTVGFLSNITTEKGIFDFFDLANKSMSMGLPIRFLVAGPVNVSIQDDFFKCISEMPNVEHLGPVYGDMKTGFFQSISVLAFPTRYANEAEPVTIHEALSAGVPVIANDKGCIGSIVNGECGLLVSDPDSFVNLSIQWLSEIYSSADKLKSLQKGASDRFATMHAENVSKLDLVLNRIAAGQPLNQST